MNKLNTKVTAWLSGLGVRPEFLWFSLPSETLQVLGAQSKNHSLQSEHRLDQGKMLSLPSVSLRSHPRPWEKQPLLLFFSFKGERKTKFLHF